MNKIPGGLSQGMSLGDLAKKHDVPVDDITNQLNKGTKVELEHTTDESIAKEIAMDHLFEDPLYYDKLKTIEEGKQVGILYHYTTLGGLVKIRDSNKLSTYVGPWRGNISFTRNKNFHKFSRDIKGTGTRIVLDGDKLSENYKISPIAEPDYQKNTKYFEFEERIKGPIENLDKYVISYDVFLTKAENEITAGSGDIYLFNIFKYYLKTLPKEKVQFYNKEGHRISWEEVRELYIIDQEVKQVAEDKKGIKAFSLEIAKQIGKHAGEELNEILNLDKEQLNKNIKEVTKYALNKDYNIKPLPNVKFVYNDLKNAKDSLGRTAHYEPISRSITLYTCNRHLKDILRSYCHELIHHIQNIEDRLHTITTDNVNEDSKLLELEREAYEKGNLLLREWENSLSTGNFHYFSSTQGPNHLTETPYEDIHPETKYWALYANIYDALKKNPEEVYNKLKKKVKGEAEKALEYFYPLAKDPSLLQEAKQLGNLYHFTSLYYVYSILKTDILKSNSKFPLRKGDYYDNFVNYISLTRDKNFYIKNPQIGGTSVRITIDGDRLSENFRIISYNDLDYSFKGDENTSKNYSGKYTDSFESEERIIIPKGKEGVYNIKKFIKRIDILDDYLSDVVTDVKKICKENNIPLYIDQQLTEINSQENNIETCIAICFKDDKVLVGKSTDSDERNGLWVFPGGGRKQGEDIYKGALRELFEETGITAEIKGNMLVLDDRPKLAWIPVNYVKGGIDFNHEFSEMKWILPKELGSEYPTLPNNKKILDQILTPITGTVISKDELTTKELVNEYQNKKELNPKIWSDQEMKPELREVLKKIGTQFYKNLEVDIPLEDILLIGSSANYNWTQYSDIDLHLLMDFSSQSNPDIFKKYFDSKKIEFNQKYNLKYKNHQIEVYVQDINEPNAAQGVYSILQDKWLKAPTYENIEISDVEIDKKAQPLMNQIDDIINGNQSIDDIKKLKERIRSFRKNGLEKGGEYSVENLAFKKMRNNGYLEKLNDYQTQKQIEDFGIEDIQEAKQRGELYHFTTFPSLIKILDQDMIKIGNNIRKHEGGVSLTRDKNFLKTPKMISKNLGVCIVLDGDKLSENYHIEPYDHFFDRLKKHTDKFITYYDVDENEEVIFKDINNVSNYITKIILFKYKWDKEIPSGGFNKFLNKIKSKTYAKVEVKMDLNESRQDVLHYDAWVIPDENTLKREYYVEHELKGHNWFKSETDFLEKIKNAKTIKITKELDSEISYRSGTSNKEELLSLIKNYRSYPEFRNEKTLDNLYNRFKENKPLDYPVILKFKEGMRIFSGNTRMDVAFHLRLEPEALLVDLTEINENIDKQELDTIEQYADDQLAPEDIKFSNHFFDRVNDPRSEGIDFNELLDFFERLSKYKDKFINFLKKYKEIVAVDSKTKLNIPFIDQANKAIAKTIMRKDNFSTSNPKLVFEAKQRGKLYHFTDFSHLWKILEENRLKGFKSEINTPGKARTSLTRDKNFGNRYRNITGGGSVRIIIDGDKLSENYHLQPYKDQIWGKKAVEKDIKTPDGDDFESEEVVLSEDGIKNLDKYVISYDIILDKILFPKRTPRLDLYLYDVFMEDKDPHVVENKKIKFYWKNKNVPRIDALELIKKSYNTNEYLINEAKQVGDVYHFTSISSFLQILADNKITAAGLSDESRTISTTRDKNFTIRPRAIGNPPEIGIILDGDKLSEKFKVRPYDYNYDNPGEEEEVGDEQEELWFGKKLGKQGGIRNIKSYIKGIVLTKNFFKKFITNQDFTIPYNFKKYLPEEWLGTMSGIDDEKVTQIYGTEDGDYRTLGYNMTAEEKISLVKDIINKELPNIKIIEK